MVVIKGVRWIEARNVTKHITMHKIATATENYPATMSAGPVVYIGKYIFGFCSHPSADLLEFLFLKKILLK